MKDIKGVFAIYGCGGFGREVAPIADHISSISCGSEVLFVDDAAPVGRELNGYRVMSFQELLNRHPDAGIVLAVGQASVRRKLADKCADAGFSFATLLAPTYRQLDAVEHGPGAIFCDFSMCTSNIKIGRHFHCNIYSYVAHDCVIGDFVTLAPRVCINGNTIIEDDVYIGTGAVIKQGTPAKPIVIEKGATIGMGAVVTKSVRAGTVVVGNPARVREIETA